MDHAELAESRQQMRSLMERHGLRAQKSLGQHFLIDHGSLEAIAGEIATLAGDGSAPGSSNGSLPVVEIGPGPGNLTAALLGRGLRLLSLELDRQWEPLHRGEFAVALDEGRLALHYGDALRVSLSDVAALLPKHNGSSAPHFIFGGNIPYQITSPLLFQAIEWLIEATDSGAPEREAADGGTDLPQLAGLVFLMQKEVAERAAAAPGSRTYGSLSAKLQLMGEPRLAASVPSMAFWPEPKVSSAVLAWIPKPPEKRPAPAQFERASRLITTAFQHRRKMAAKTLAGLVPGGREAIETFLKEAGYDHRARPEQIAPTDFLKLVEN